MSLGAGLEAGIAAGLAAGLPAWLLVLLAPAAGSFLAVLADRGGRELPVAADLCAAQVSVPAGHSLELARDDAGGRLRFVLEALQA